MRATADDAGLGGELQVSKSLQLERRFPGLALALTKRVDPGSVGRCFKLGSFVTEHAVLANQVTEFIGILRRLAKPTGHVKLLVVVLLHLSLELVEIRPGLAVWQLREGERISVAVAGVARLTSPRCPYAFALAGMGNTAAKPEHNRSDGWLGLGLRLRSSGLQAGVGCPQKVF